MFCLDNTLLIAGYMQRRTVPTSSVWTIHCWLQVTCKEGRCLQVLSGHYVVDCRLHAKKDGAYKFCLDNTLLIVGYMQRRTVPTCSVWTIHCWLQVTCKEGRCLQVLSGQYIVDCRLHAKKDGAYKFCLDITLLIVGYMQRRTVPTSSVWTIRCWL